MADLTSKERTLLDEARKLLRQMRDDIFNGGALTGRSQRAGEELIHRIDDALSAPYESGLTSPGESLPRVTVETAAPLAVRPPEKINSGGGPDWKFKPGRWPVQQGDMEAPLSYCVLDEIRAREVEHRRSVKEGWTIDNQYTLDRTYLLGLIPPRWTDRPAEKTSRNDEPVVQEARRIARCDTCERVADNSMAGQRCFAEDACGALCGGTLFTVL